MAGTIFFRFIHFLYVKVNKKHGALFHPDMSDLLEGKLNRFRVDSR